MSKCLLGIEQPCNECRMCEKGRIQHKESQIHKGKEKTVTLILPMKREWFEMELSGEKKEEYREIKPYWIVRVLKWLGWPKSEEKKAIELLSATNNLIPREVLFRNGYSASCPSFIGMCTVRIGTGREEWGAEKDKKYFVFTIHAKRNLKNIKNRSEIIEKINSRQK